MNQEEVRVNKTMLSEGGEHVEAGHLTNLSTRGKAELLEIALGGWCDVPEDQSPSSKFRAQRRRNTVCDSSKPQVGQHQNSQQRIESNEAKRRSSRRFFLKPKVSKVKKKLKETFQSQETFLKPKDVFQ